MIRYLVLCLLSLSSLSASNGAFINPLTDVCWDCLFPMTVSGINVTPHVQDLTSYNQRVCTCPGIPPKVGIPLSFWEPTRMVDVTRHAYKLIGLGGISIGSENIKNRGSIGVCDESGLQHSFYHVHWYQYPILSVLELFTDFLCVEKGDLDIGYMSEFDLLWNNDEFANVLEPESELFSNPLAQVACIADCTKSTFSTPSDSLFWCAGCSGSLYPFTGTISHHVGGIQASSLILQRTIAKLHRTGIVTGYSSNNFCQAEAMPIIKKTLYKTQLAHPIPQTHGPCHALGKSDVLWGAGKSFPVKGEDFVYIVWTKKQCCLDAVKTSATGGAL
jgi:conjugal transfer pilus assembly protein TraU